MDECGGVIIKFPPADSSSDKVKTIQLNINKLNYMDFLITRF